MMRLRTDIRLRKIGEEYIIVDPGQDMVDMSKAYTFNETAAFIWNELQNIEFSVSTIAQLLRDNYDLSSEIADKNAKELVKQLQTVFFKLLRSGLWNTPIDENDSLLLSDEEWEALFVLCVNQTVEAIVFDALERLNPSFLPPKHILLKWVDMVPDSAYRIQQAQLTRIQKGDRISIVVSSKNPELAAPFNLGEGMYNVNEKGNISTSTPNTGGANVAKEDCSLEELKELIRKKLIDGRLINEPIVRTELLNFKVNVMGEINRVGVLDVPDGSITLFDAVSRAGGLTTNGAPNKIAVIREENGVRKMTINVYNLKTYSQSPTMGLPVGLVQMRYCQPDSELTIFIGTRRQKMGQKAIAGIWKIQNFLMGWGAYSAYVHSKGLKAGLYSEGGNEYLWIDVGDNDTKEVKPEAGFNLCRWQFPGEWAIKLVDSWRISGDIRNNFESVLEIIDLNRNLYKYSSPGHYNDMDMLQVGRGIELMKKIKDGISYVGVLLNHPYGGNDLLADSTAVSSGWNMSTGNIYNDILIILLVVVLIVLLFTALSVSKAIKSILKITMPEVLLQEQAEKLRQRSAP
ncbi:hypothetical protein FQR65_LT19085 [Abscondita terminalis]|nr:hypothetical protein FQR65_LT19085 [Abscondita terminalis]